MGIQIYISVESIKEAGIEVKFHEETTYGYCKCGNHSKVETSCEECGTPALKYTDKYASINGLPLMSVMDNYVYHDANHWGSSRAKIIEFINENKLMAGQDWYEA